MPIKPPIRMKYIAEKSMANKVNAVIRIATMINMMIPTMSPLRPFVKTKAVLIIKKTTPHLIPMKAY